MKPRIRWMSYGGYYLCHGYSGGVFYCGTGSTPEKAFIAWRWAV